ncbi:MAG: ABC transporter ATP-binding protein [Clostridia bacterium]|nr:ABC transporter ATP-binding protein [Clostridia bacterium]
MKTKTILRVLKYLEHYRLLLALSLLFAAASVALTLSIPVLTGDAIDLLAGEQTFSERAVFGLLARLVAPMGITHEQLNSIPAILILICIAIGITALLQWLMNVCNNRIAFGIVRRLRQDAFERIQTLPLSYLDAHPVGDTVSRVISDADAVTDGLLLGFSQFFTGILTILGTLLIMFSVHPGIALVVVLVTPLSLFVAAFITKKTHTYFQNQSRTRAEQTAIVDEMIGNHKLVTAFNRADEAVADFDRVNDRLAKISLKATFFSSLTNPSTRFVNNLVYAGVVLVGALMAIATGGAALSVGQLSCFLSYANQYTKPFNEISGVITELQNALTCAGRLFELIDEQSETPDAPDALILEEARGEVAFDSVSFSYVPERPLIKDLSLSVKQGQRVAIVGPTGCGKTTLINLLMRFYDTTKGDILVDGTPTRDITRNSLRQNVGMVLQDTHLAHDTVRANIALGHPDATDEQIVAAAKACHAHSFIKRLPKGYDTVIGGDNDTLSQGQRQLLCIARVMLRLPPMLILDEATSSIDTRTEQKIQSAFAQMMKGRTSFIVAHRLSTIKQCDLILVMQDGDIVERGTHDSLLAADGLYAKLYHSQFEE